MPKSFARKKPKKWKYYDCKWCGDKKREDDFFKCSIDHEKFICTDCIKAKYNDLCDKCSKENALLIMCHYLDIPFYWDICKSLCVGEDIGIYVRQCNIAQYDLTSFEEGFISAKLDYTNTYLIDKERICTLIGGVQERLEAIKKEV